MWICRYFVYFVIFSCMGWIYESIFCTIKNKKWADRGFLYGPLCPIYGVGAVSLTAIAEAFSKRSLDGYAWWQVFLVAFFGSIVLEYVTSWALEKLFHAYWWDYSRMPLNINGRVCFPYSVGFGCAGLLVVYVIAPFTQNMTSGITPIAMEGLSLWFMAMIAADVTLTVSALTDFERNVAALDVALNQHMEQMVSNVQEKKQAAETAFAEERVRFSKERMEQTVASMGNVHRMAVSRVRGFRNTRADKQRMEDMLRRMKSRVPKKK
jgi:uncharacterized membrane protein